MVKETLEVSVVIPCLNEEDTIGICIDKVKQVFEKNALRGEIIVVDNGSTDRSREIALSRGAKVIDCPVRGYGAAYIEGFRHVRGRYIIMGDGDDTYDFLEIPRLIDELKEGSDLVLGSRFKGRILKNAMPFLHRYIGNPILTKILNIFYHAHITDAHTGFRGITKEALEKLSLNCRGMEFASEMLIKAIYAGLKIKEIGINYYPRKGESKLNPLVDGWRHLRFLLLFSPTYLFIIPGSIIFLLSLLFTLLVAQGKIVILGHQFDIHAMIFSGVFALCGYQIIFLGLCAKTYSVVKGIFKEDKYLRLFYKIFSCERGVILGLFLSLIGSGILVYVFIRWFSLGFGELFYTKISFVALILVVLGIQTIFYTFFIDLLNNQ